MNHPVVALSGVFRAIAMVPRLFGSVSAVSKAMGASEAMPTVASVVAVAVRL